MLANQSGQIDALKDNFEEPGYPQGTSQVGLPRQKFENLVEVLKCLLSASEITYGRYVGMAAGYHISLSGEPRSFARLRAGEGREALSGADEIVFIINAPDGLIELFDDWTIGRP